MFGNGPITQRKVTLWVGGMGLLLIVVVLWMAWTDYAKKSTPPIDKMPATTTKAK